jgi:hypothetical protein
MIERPGEPESSYFVTPLTGSTAPGEQVAVAKAAESLNAQFGTATIPRRPDAKWGIPLIHNEYEPNAFRVLAIEKGGAVDEYNTTARESKGKLHEVRIGDYIIRINGVPSDSGEEEDAIAKMQEEIRKSRTQNELVLEIARFNANLVCNFNKCPDEDFGLDLDKDGFICGVQPGSPVDTANTALRMQGKYDEVVQMPMRLVRVNDTADPEKFAGLLKKAGTVELELRRRPSD